MAAPTKDLSLHAIAKEWNDQRGVDGIGFVRALRSILTSHLPQLQPRLESIINNSLHGELRNVGPNGSCNAISLMSQDSDPSQLFCLLWRRPWLMQVAAHNDEFTRAALEFPQVTVFAAEILRLSPGFLQPLIASWATNGHWSSTTLFKHLAPIVEKRLALRDRPSKSLPPTDCMQWIIDTSPRKNPWTTSRTVGEIMALWFGSIHQLAMVRRRKALKSFVFSDGSSINKGDWVCVPQAAMMRDPQRYNWAHIFDGFRFARANEALRRGHEQHDVPDSKESTLTDATLDWPIWGFGNTACPGRFYAALVGKLFMIRILDRYDCRMRDPAASRFRVWRSSMVPRNDTIVEGCLE
ncbi:cytochrome P450 [Stachybotrys elegans]|uniref:Cytochrome P450 n=1 Tax=Stachybotrys elegans TaxID=80388 RepID=A0A8K0WW36_9HYPO|nr:cytochrome P450 [Stachybotrys elegans]